MQPNGFLWLSVCDIEYFMKKGGGSTFFYWKIPMNVRYVRMSMNLSFGTMQSNKYSIHIWDLEFFSVNVKWIRIMGKYWCCDWFISKKKKAKKILKMISRQWNDEGFVIIALLFNNTQFFNITFKENPKILIKWKEWFFELNSHTKGRQTNNKIPKFWFNKKAGFCICLNATTSTTLMQSPTIIFKHKAHTTNTNKINVPSFKWPYRCLWILFFVTFLFCFIFGCCSQT